MKIAILYTGELRTIKKTIDYFINNILNFYDCSVFASLQGSSYGQILNKNEYRKKLSLVKTEAEKEEVLDLIIEDASKIIASQKF